MNECDDEMHIISSCDLYNPERTSMLESFKNFFPHIINYNQDELFIWLMANLNENVILALAKYIYIQVSKNETR